MDTATRDAILSGRRRTVAAAVLRGGLAVAEPFYTAAAVVHGRNRHRRRVALPVPVVSVGNVTCGGTGKTPVVAHVVSRLTEAGRSPGILSRGYRSLDDGKDDGSGGNDERRVLDALCPGVPHEQSRDRIAAGRALIDAGCDALVLDDGFQYRGLARDLDLVVVDALNPFGYGHCLPRGLLREPLASLARADAVLLNRSDAVSRETRERIVRDVAAHTDAPITLAQVKPTQLVGVDGRTAPLDRLGQTATLAFCGLGNPDGFAATLDGLEAARLGEVVAFPDHHHYAAGDLARLDRIAADRGAEALVCTRKDLVKLSAATIGGRPVWAVDIALTLDGVCEPLERLVEGLKDEG